MEIKELGHVVLYVHDIERSAAFYRDVLGFRQILGRRRWALRRRSRRAAPTTSCC